MQPLGSSAPNLGRRANYPAIPQLPQRVSAKIKHFGGTGVLQLVGDALQTLPGHDRPLALQDFEHAKHNRVNLHEPNVIVATAINQ